MINMFQKRYYVQLLSAKGVSCFHNGKQERLPKIKKKRTGTSGPVGTSLFLSKKII